MQNDPLKQLSKQRKPLIGDDHYFYGKCEKKKNGIVNMISGQIFNNKISLRNTRMHCQFIVSNLLYVRIFNDLIFK